MGDATRPPCPLVAQRGGTAVPPLWKPLPELDGGAAAEREAEGVLFAPRCAPCPQMRRRTDLRFRYSAAGRWVLDFVGSAYRPFLPMGELAALPVNSSLTFFLFHRARRIFFLMFQKENGGCIPHGKAVLPVPEAGTALCTIKARSKQPSCEMPKSMV